MNRRGSSALAAVTLSLLATTAPGANALEKRTAPSETKPNGFSVAIAECPGEQRVVSGGYRLEPGSSDTPITNRAKGERAWIVEAEEDDFTAYVLCSRNINATEVAKSVGFKNSSRGRGTPARVKCPGDKRVISGGFQFSRPASNSPVFRSRPTDAHSWSVLALSERDDSDLKVLAYCVNEPRDIAFRKDSARVEDNEVETVEAKCKSSETRLSGGWTVTPRPDWNNSEGPDTFFSSAYPSAQGAFLATAINFSSVAGRISAFAVCAA